ncbi:hypothetical protein EHQ58_16165 [Leptospira ognonensis]|uniref:Uncharacterized protein n=1 Tax=Leptospira ognonensis TaxID=2484945 RepID=A0A4R9JYN6_9LEPT|nr:hypothetical protein [Leptospira ognonensis]TGL56728.1 hypothetical protein EHQ58_16165 [Leptospira ognonensis]
MKSSAVLIKLVLVYATFSMHSLVYAETGTLLLNVIASNQQSHLILINQDSETTFEFPTDFQIKDRIQISKERILSFSSSYSSNRKITSYEWRTGRVTEQKNPLDTGIKILREFISYLEGLNRSVFQEIHQVGYQRLFEWEGDKPLFFPHFDKYRKTVRLDDFLPSGAHIFRILEKDRSIQKIENSFVGANDGYSQKLLYCSSLNCKPEEILSDRAILSARLIDDGRLVAFFTPVSVDPESKSYNLETYDINEKKRKKLFTFKMSIKGPTGTFNLSNPEFRVLNQSSLFLFTDEIADIEDKIQNWKLVDGRTGKVEDFKVPDGYQFVSMMPVSYHKSSNESDLTTLEPYIVFIKRSYDQKLGIRNHLKVIQLPERKIVLEKEIIGKTVINAMYVSDAVFLNKI